MILLAFCGVAAADPDLKATHEPAPPKLHMRRTAAAPDGPAAKPKRSLRALVPAPPPPLAAVSDDELAGLRDVREPVSFSLTLGYQVDAAHPSGSPALGGATPTAGKDYAAVRSFGFGELFFSTRGVALDSLSTYFALRLDAARELTANVDGVEQRLAPPIATWFQKTLFETRTGWAELKDFLPTRWGLKKLRLRGGDQYVYGPWVLHLDGALAAYDGSLFSATAYAGNRHADYSPDVSRSSDLIFGASARLDLHNLSDKVPLAFAGDFVKLVSLTDQPDVRSSQFEADWRPRRGIAVIAQIRALNEDVASEQIEVRAQLRQVTNLVFVLQHRTADDWRWDPSLIVQDDPTQARRWLDLGPTLPQLIASVRAGTLIAENVDLLVRGAGATDLASAEDLAKLGVNASSFTQPWVELGGAVELRLRRTVAIGASALDRQTKRVVLQNGPIMDLPGIAQPLPTSAATGEASFTEVGAHARMSLGARKFSATLEVYGRRTRYPDDYTLPTGDIKLANFRGGGRFSVDAWVGKRVRLFAAYDLSTAYDLAPEITGYQSLKLTLTGTY